MSKITIVLTEEQHALVHSALDLEYGRATKASAKLEAAYVAAVAHEELVERTLGTVFWQRERATAEYIAAHADEESFLED